MTPLEIRILLHYSWSPEDYQSVENNGHATSPAVHSALAHFLNEGLLTSRYSDHVWAISAPFLSIYEGRPVEHPIFSITEKGMAMVQHLCEVEIPVCKWVQPEKST